MVGKRFALKEGIEEIAADRHLTITITWPFKQFQRRQAPSLDTIAQVFQKGYKLHDHSSTSNGGCL